MNATTDSDSTPLPSPKLKKLMKDIEIRSPFFTVDIVSRIMNTDVDSIRGMDADGRILTIRRSDSLLFPAIQFSSTGEVLSVFRRLLEIFKVETNSGEVLLKWLHAPNGWLPDCQKPIDYLDKEDEIVEAATNMFNVW